MRARLKVQVSNVRDGDVYVDNAQIDVPEDLDPKTPIDSIYLVDDDGDAMSVYDLLNEAAAYYLKRKVRSGAR